MHVLISDKKIDCLSEKRDNFWWFPHMWHHEQPHKFQLPALERGMSQNYHFAKVEPLF